MDYSTGVFKIFDKIAASIRERLNPDRLLKIEFETHNSQRFLGLAITALGLILSVVLAIKTDKLSILLIGFAWTVGFPILFWSNLKMIKQTQLLSLRYKSKISDAAYLEILTVFYLFGAIVGVAAALYFAVAFSSVKILISGLIACISILITMTFLARYELLGIEQEPSATIWENAVSILSIPLRIISRLAGLAFAFSNMLLVLGLLYIIYLIVSGLDSLDFFQIFTGLSMVVGGLTSAVYLSSPLLIYLIALSLYLLVRLLAQLAGIPGSNAGDKSDLGLAEVHLTFVSNGEDQTVVLSGEDARNLYLSGTMNPCTLVWMDGMQDWLPVSEVGF
jgi:hypothetical protein